MIFMGSQMTFLHKMATCAVYISQLACYIWVFVSDPGLATIPIIEFRAPLAQDKAE
jgi:hypothetical protein